MRVTYSEYFGLLNILSCFLQLHLHKCTIAVWFITVTEGPRLRNVVKGPLANTSGSCRAGSRKLALLCCLGQLCLPETERGVERLLQQNLFFPEENTNTVYSWVLIAYLQMGSSGTLLGCSGYYYIYMLPAPVFAPWQLGLFLSLPPSLTDT